MIHVGDTQESERVEIPIFHTGVFGQSGVGKTKLLKYMISQVVNEGYSVLIFDAKITGPEFEDIGLEIPFYLEESTDPDVFRSLIEGMRPRGKGNMERYRGGFIEVCDPGDGKPAKDFKEIGERLDEKLTDKKIRGYTRSMYSEIKRDYRKLMELLSDHKFAPEVKGGGEKIIRMPTWKLPNLNLQGLIVGSTTEYALKYLRKVIVLVDEAPNFVSQKEFNPAKSSLQRLDAQGRKGEVFGWYSGQTITGFDKANMKNLWYWIMGREMERNEAKDVYETQSSKVLKIDEIKTLKVRQFIVSTPDVTKLVTVPKIEEKELFPRGSWEGLIRGTEQEAYQRAPSPEDWEDVYQRAEEVLSKA